jgi:hypothetical protein
VRVAKRQSPDWLFDCAPFPEGECGFDESEPAYPEVTHRTFYSRIAHKAHELEETKRALLEARRLKRLDEELQQRLADSEARREAWERRAEERFVRAEKRRHESECRYRISNGIKMVVIENNVYIVDPTTGQIVQRVR